MAITLDGTTGAIGGTSLTATGAVSAGSLSSTTESFANIPAVSTPASMVRLNTANGYGSTNTKIRRFTNIVTNQGSDITYADSATLGASFTINTNGVYSISHSDQFNVANTFGITNNTTAPTGAISAAVPIGEILCMTSTAAAAFAGCVSVCIYLPSGSVLRAHGDGSATGAIPNACHFIITRVS